MRCVLKKEEGSEATVLFIVRVDSCPSPTGGLRSLKLFEGAELSHCQGRQARRGHSHGRRCGRETLSSSAAATAHSFLGLILAGRPTHLVLIPLLLRNFRICTLASKRLGNCFPCALCSSGTTSYCVVSCRTYRAPGKCLYVVERNFFLLLLNFFAWPCLGPA